MRIRSRCLPLPYRCWSWSRLPAASPAQQPASSQPVRLHLKVQAREVVLPVTVRDKKGELVTSLKVSDFTLTEDGRPQTIKSFTRESNLPFRLGLLVDTSRSMLGRDGERAQGGGQVCGRDAARKAESRTRRGQDQAFLIHFDREVELL